MKSMVWFKRKGTTGKIEPSKQFLLEEKLTFQRCIASIIEEHGIPKKLILNLDQKHLSYVFPGKYNFNPKSAKTVPIKGIDDKRQITVNKPAKSFISNKYNEWLCKKGIQPVDVKVSLVLTELKVMHAKWILEL